MTKVNKRQKKGEKENDTEARTRASHHKWLVWTDRKKNLKDLFE